MSREHGKGLKIARELFRDPGAQRPVQIKNPCPDADAAFGQYLRSRRKSVCLTLPFGCHVLCHHGHSQCEDERKHELWWRPETTRTASGSAAATGLSADYSRGCTLPASLSSHRDERKSRTPSLAHSSSGAPADALQDKVMARRCALSSRPVAPLPPSPGPVRRADRPSPSPYQDGRKPHL